MLKWGRRIFLFLLVNLLVILTINIALSVLGVRPYLNARGIDYGSLLVFCTVWGFGGALISLALSGVMAKWMMGVRVIDPENPGSNEESKLVQTVRRLAEKAGLRMPQVGIYDSPEPNAFATGPTKNSALVAVSSGLLRSMDQDEIEGVLGHELTHVVNGDMVTMTLIQGVINSFVYFLAYVVSILLARGDSDDRRGGSLTEYLLRNVLIMVFGILGSIPVMAFSRWREFRADAGGAKLAGRSKMINALKALQGLQEARMAARNEPKAIAAFKISSRDGWALFASHPPLEERIERLQSASLVIAE